MNLWNAASLKLSGSFLGIWSKNLRRPRRSDFDMMRLSMHRSPLAVIPRRVGSTHRTELARSFRTVGAGDRCDAWVSPSIHLCADIGGVDLLALATRARFQRLSNRCRSFRHEALGVHQRVEQHLGSFPSHTVLTVLHPTLERSPCVVTGV